MLPVVDMLARMEVLASMLTWCHRGYVGHGRGHVSLHLRVRVAFNTWYSGKIKAEACEKRMKMDGHQ